MRQPWWEWGLWQYRASIAQANAGGGAIVVDFFPLQGVTMIVLWARGTNSGTNSLQIVTTDEDNIVNPFWSSIASAAGSVGTVPRTFNATTDSDFIDTTDMAVRMIRANDGLTIRQTGAGAQNDTLVVELRALLSSPERALVSKARSTNQADVTIAAPTVNKIR